MDTQNQNNKYYTNHGSMDKDFFTEYIRSYIQKNLQHRCDKILDDYKYIEYYSIGLKSNRVASYSELWFLDINLSDNNFLPVYMTHILSSLSFLKYNLPTLIIHVDQV